jgi:hypothetical protein
LKHEKVTKFDPTGSDLDSDGSIFVTVFRRCFAGICHRMVHAARKRRAVDFLTKGLIFCRTGAKMLAFP